MSADDQAAAMIDVRFRWGCRTRPQRLDSSRRRIGARRDFNIRGVRADLESMISSRDQLSRRWFGNGTATADVHPVVRPPAFGSANGPACSPRPTVDKKSLISPTIITQRRPSNRWPWYVSMVTRADTYAATPGEIPVP